MKLRFICGCMTGDVVDRENLKTMDAVKIDSEGFLVCAHHFERRYGWRSLPALAVGNDYKFAQFSELEIEGHLVFGDDLPFAVAHITESRVDMRDNRDPSSLTEEVRKSKKYPYGVRSLVAR